MVRSLGADHVIDYKKEDFTRNGQRYDLILAANGYHPISAYLRALSPEGVYVVAGGAMAQSSGCSQDGGMPGGSQKVFVRQWRKSTGPVLYERT
jgi:NADPH:quinone reductase-like Zn-dependent oxidoreductase